MTDREDELLDAVMLWQVEAEKLCVENKRLRALLCEVDEFVKEIPHFKETMAAVSGTQGSSDG